MGHSSLRNQLVLGTSGRLPCDIDDVSRVDGDGSVSDHFERIADSIPNRVAVKTTRHCLTYDMLNRAANRIARAILAKAPPGDRPLTLLLDRGAWLSAAILGVLKARGIYVVLNPLHPRARLKYIQEDSRAHLMVTDHHHLPLAMELAHDRLLLMNIDEIAPDLCSENLGLPASSSCVASITYTSGSTGQPKGVIHSHGFLMNRRLAGKRLGIGIEDRVATVGSASSQFRSLLNGAGSFPWNVKQDGLSKLANWLREQKITVFHAVPSVFRDFADSLTGADEFPDLRLINLRGETLYRSDVELYKNCFGARCSLVNEFGASETGTIGQYAIDKETEVTGNIVPVGHVLEDKSVLLLDDEGKDVGAGQVGEIAVRSRNLSPGYWRNPTLTNARFRPDPRGGDERIYLTGDLGRMLPNGCLVHVGRKDSQVKIRAQRIELAEIEAALRHLDNIQEAAVVAREDRPGDKRLVAYVVAATVPAPNVTTMLRGLAQCLPDYMIPTTFVMLGALPLTANGKVDRLALPAPGRGRPNLAVGYYAPRTPNEELLAGIWCEVLGIDQIGIRDNFFELGGHSLLATRVVARLRDAFAVDLPVRSLFETPTVSGLAERVETARSRPATVPDIRLHPVPRDRKLPLSFAQERLWFLEQLEPGGAAYNIPYEVRLHGRLNVPALEQSLRELVWRHEVLRTTFTATEGIPEQVVSGKSPFPLEIIDLQNISEPERESQARRLAAEEAGRPFDLSRDLMLRARLLRIADEEHVLALTVHHIASDGWSMGVLWRELTALYEAFSVGKPSPLPELPVQYADYAVWQRHWLQSEVLDRQLPYWKERLAAAPAVLELPADFPRPTVPSFRGARQKFMLDRELTKALQKLGHREGTTLFMTLLAAWQVLLARYSGQEEIVVGSPIAGRNRTELEGLIGFFVNTLVLRTDLSGNPTFRELLKRVREVTLGAYAHQDLPFEKLVEELRPERSRGHDPLFQVMFALQNAPSSSLELSGVTVSRLAVDNATAKFDLTLSLHETAEGIRGSLAYNTDLFEAATIARLAGHFEVLLKGIAADPERRIGALPLLTEAERHQLLVQWNQTATDYPRDQCVHRLFEEQVERTPNAVAVVWRDRQVTYRELNARANRLAHYLVSLTPAAGGRVTVFMERSVEFIVSVLAILKTGAAYVPLDTSEPPARLRLLIEDTGTSIILAGTSHRPDLHLPDTRLVVVDKTAFLDQQSDHNLPGQSQAGDVACIFYTSGSTGRPKGVVVPHRGIVRLVRGTNYASFDECQRFLFLASPAFDAWTYEVWGALLHGSTCVVYPGSVLDLADLEATLRERRITCLFLTTSLFNLIIDQRPEMLAGVTQLLTGGEAVSVSHFRRIRERQPQLELVHCYGPTENTTFSTTFSVPGEIAPGLSTIPIGRPIANTEVYVLNEAREPVPIGVPGELFLGGDGLAQGYLNGPELTAEKFVPHAFSDLPEARLYRTGDLVRWRADGNLEFLGRLDGQVKLRGFRIECGEIEATLAEHSQVRQAVVHLREDSQGDKRLVAYVIPQTLELSPSAADLRHFLQERLPEYMVPSALVSLDAFPLTANGKLDRRELPIPQAGECEQVSVAPRTHVEEQLAELWREVLGIERLGIHDNFFDLGGHSLLAIQLFGRIEQRFQKRLPLALLFQHGTVAEIARHLTDENLDDRDVTVVELQPGEAGRRRLFFMTNMWGELMDGRRLLSYLGKATPVYGLQPSLAKQALATFSDFERLAASCVSALREFQPHGPYALIGYSYGGLLAFEVARQIAELGDVVDLLALLDRGPGNRGRVRPMSEQIGRWFRVLRNLPRWLVDDANNSPRNLYWRTRRMLRRTAPHWLLRLLGKSTAIGLGDEADHLRNSAPNQELTATLLRAFREYRPKAYPGTVTLIRSRTDPLFAGYPKDLGWNRFAKGGVDVRVVPGHHLVLLEEPSVLRVAEELQKCLSRLDMARIPTGSA